MKAGNLPPLCRIPHFACSENGNLDWRIYRGGNCYWLLIRKWWKTDLQKLVSLHSHLFSVSTPSDSFVFVGTIRETERCCGTVVWHYTGRAHGTNLTCLCFCFCCKQIPSERIPLQGMSTFLNQIHGKIKSNQAQNFLCSCTGEMVTHPFNVLTKLLAAHFSWAQWTPTGSSDG